MTERKETKPRTKKVIEDKIVASEPVSYIHIDEFLETAKAIYPNDINAMVIAGFKAHLAPNLFFIDELELKNKLDIYLGK